MTEVNNPPAGSEKKIVVVENGPYKVLGKISLVRKTQIVSEFGEPLTWEKLGDIQTGSDTYLLCRCGKSKNMPFCDQTHLRSGFDGTEQAKTAGPSRWQITFPGGTRLIVTKDVSLCMNSGFCNLRNTGIDQLTRASDDTQLRSLAIAMVERCPSGSLTYKVEPASAIIEPDYPQQIADTIEITSDGPIAGPLWVTGCVPIERADGKPFTARNRVTLCSCGQSNNKPLCDGTHRSIAEETAKKKKRGNG
ncbi:MAG: CDGSH iron-sulfur domain-containing protein [Anaerolineaceae bacterium]